MYRPGHQQNLLHQRAERVTFVGQRTEIDRLIDAQALSHARAERSLPCLAPGLPLSHGGDGQEGG